MGEESFFTTQAAAVATSDHPSRDCLAEDVKTARRGPDHGRLRVLIADDADAADSLALLLTFWGHEVWKARSGGEALATVFRCQPDVLLLRVAMPDLDGFCVARAIRHQPSLDGVLLVAITECADDVHRQLALHARFDHNLARPVDPAAVEALLFLAADRKEVNQARRTVARQS